VKDDWEFYALIGMILLIEANLWVHSRHLKLHDEMLFGDSGRAASEALGG
jgi:hypothetical protein